MTLHSLGELTVMLTCAAIPVLFALVVEVWFSGRP